MRAVRGPAHLEPLIRGGVRLMTPRGAHLYHIDYTPWVVASPLRRIWISGGVTPPGGRVSGDGAGCPVVVRIILAMRTDRREGAIVPNILSYVHLSTSVCMNGWYVDPQGWGQNRGR